MSTQLQIYNMTIANMGEELLTAVAADATGTDPNTLLNVFWDGGEVDTILEMGPEEGWRFARRTFNCMGVDSSSITAFADYSGTVAGTVLATDALHPYISGDAINIKDGSVGSYDATQVITVVDANSYYFTATFVSTETATAQWTSEKFGYRFPEPTSVRVTAVSVGGVELTDWEKEGAYILTNQQSTEVDMNYILPLASLTVTNFPAHFVSVLWRYLRVLLAYNFIQNKSMGDQWLQELETIYIPRAIGADNRHQYVKEENLGWVEVGRVVSVIQ